MLILAESEILTAHGYLAKRKNSGLNRQSQPFKSCLNWSFDIYEQDKYHAEVSIFLLPRGIFVVCFFLVFLSYIFTFFVTKCVCNLNN